MHQAAVEVDRLIEALDVVVTPTQRMHLVAALAAARRDDLARQMSQRRESVSTAVEPAAGRPTSPSG